MSDTLQLRLETPEGPGRFVVDRPDPSVPPAAVLVLGHGAGGGVDARDLSLLARRLPVAGITVARFEQPWRTAGGRVAVRPPRLDVAWLAALPQLRALPGCDGPLVVGGRSAGARVACRTATELGAVAVVCLAFPLHLPGRPDRSRLAELLVPRVPRLVFQGTRDAFGTPAQIRAGLGSDDGDRSDVRIVELDGADHSFRIAKGAPLTAAGLGDLLTGSIVDLVGEIGVAGGRE